MIMENYMEAMEQKGDNFQDAESRLVQRGIRPKPGKLWHLYMAVGGLISGCMALQIALTPGDESTAFISWLVASMAFVCMVAGLVPIVSASLHDDVVLYLSPYPWELGGKAEGWLVFPKVLRSRHPVSIRIDLYKITTYKNREEQSIAMRKMWSLYAEARVLPAISPDSGKSEAYFSFSLPDSLMPSTVVKSGGQHVGVTTEYYWYVTARRFKSFWFANVYEVLVTTPSKQVGSG